MGHCFIITNFVIVIKMINKQQTILIDNNNPMMKNPKPYDMAKQRKHSSSRSKARWCINFTLGFAKLP